MKKTEQKYQAFVQILKEELIPAMGCTEPISLAYGASIARKVLNHLPTKIVVEASGSIIKNVKSVIVPHTHHLKGIKAAVCAGIIGGNDDKYLEVLSQIDEKTKKEIDQYIEKVDFEEHFLDSSKVFDYIITVWNKKDYVKVRISDSHMHVVCIEKNGQILQEEKSVIKKEKADRSLLDIKDIYDFIKTVELTDIQDILDGLGAFWDINYSAQKKKNEVMLETAEKIVYAILGFDGIHISEIVAQTGLSVPQTMEVLASLEQKKLVNMVGQHYYALKI